jgi:hypothetical protein
MHGVQTIAKAAPAIGGPPRPARCTSPVAWSSRFKRVKNGAARKKAPIATISTAESDARPWLGAGRLGVAR